MYACTYLTKKNSEHSRKNKRRKGQKTCKRWRNRGGKQRNKGQGLWNRATEKGTLDQLIGVRGRRKEDGTQENTDHGRKGTETGDRGLETVNRDVRQGT